MRSLQNILVCITQQKTCERLIRKAVELKGKTNCGLYVIHVAKNEWNFLDNASEGEALEYLFDISKSVGADLYVLKSDDIVNTIADFAKENEIKLIRIIMVGKINGIEAGVIRERLRDNYV